MEYKVKRKVTYSRNVGEGEKIEKGNPLPVENILPKACLGKTLGLSTGAFAGQLTYAGQHGGQTKNRCIKVESSQQKKEIWRRPHVHRGCGGPPSSGKVPTL